jgi:hypothetical protein
MRRARRTRHSSTSTCPIRSCGRDRPHPGHPRPRYCVSPPAVASSRNGRVHATSGGRAQRPTGRRRPDRCPHLSRASRTRAPAFATGAQNHSARHRLTGERVLPAAREGWRAKVGRQAALSRLRGSSHALDRGGLCARTHRRASRRQRSACCGQHSNSGPCGNYRRRSGPRAYQ